MDYYVLTLFPDMIRSAAEESILGRAAKNGLIKVETVNIRDFATDRNRRVDDYPYGGGAGMVIEAEPVYRAVESVEKKLGHRPRVVYLTPQGRVLNQTMVESLAREEELILLCGHYEGIDERVLEEVVTDNISIGDYVLTGGELGALVMIDAISRFVPGVLGSEESTQFESLQDNLLEYPQYTRPEVWRDRKVPEILLTGDHRRIEAWRQKESKRRTAERRPDLLKKNYQVTCIWCGGEDAGHLAQDIAREVSRYSEVCDYNRKKLMRQKREMGRQELLLLVLPPSPELPAAERLLGLSGSDTPAVILHQGGEMGEGGASTLLSEKGFRVFSQLVVAEDPPQEVIADIALQIRIRLEEL